MLIIPAAASYWCRFQHSQSLTICFSCPPCDVWLSLFFQFKTHSHLFDVTSEAEEKEEPKMTTKDASILLILATVLVGWMAEVLVHSVDAAAEGWGLPTLFIGVILLPFFGNAAEHFTAVLVAGKDKMDLHLQSPSVRVFKLLSLLLQSWFYLLGRWVSTFHSSLVSLERLNVHVRSRSEFHSQRWENQLA